MAREDNFFFGWYCACVLGSGGGWISGNGIEIDFPNIFENLLKLNIKLNELTIRKNL